MTDFPCNPYSYPHSPSTQGATILLSVKGNIIYKYAASWAVFLALWSFFNEPVVFVNSPETVIIIYVET